MKPRLQALRALRLNYRWKGVRAWLTVAQHCWACGGTKGADCYRCHGAACRRGYQRIFSEPERVIQEQHAIAEGAFV